jgi:hypothetical protein
MSARNGSQCTRAPAFVLERCVCTEKEVRWSFFLLVVTMALVAASLWLFFSAVRYVKAWVAEKERLRDEVKALSRRAGAVIRDAHQRALSADAASGPADADPFSSQQQQQQQYSAYGVPPYPGAGYAPLGQQQQQQQRSDAAAASGPARPRGETPAETRARMAEAAAHDPAVHAMLDALESTRLGSCGTGFVFAFDSLGGVWAHGKTRHLARGACGRVPGFHCVGDDDLGTDPSVGTWAEDDGTGSANAPPGVLRTARGARSTARRRFRGPLAEMMAAARRGGGYVHFRWKRETLMMAYVHPVKGTDLIMGGALPVPRNQRAWEESNATRSAGAAGAGAAPARRRPLHR